jgi:lipopolysaccharide export LptBFGC system permease protein LptF
MTYQEFKNKYIDKAVNVDGAYGAQCYDLVMAYMKEAWGIDHNLICRWSGGVRDFAEHFSEMFDTSKFQYEANGATNLPPQGAVFVFANNQWGHTGIVESANQDTFVSLDQNWGNGLDGSGQGDKRVRLVTHNYQTMLGWITPKQNQNNNNNNQNNNNQSDMALQQDLNAKNQIIDKVKTGGWTLAKEIQDHYPNYYDNWGRAMGNIGNLETENPYTWVREMADQISWNYVNRKELAECQIKLANSEADLGQATKDLQDTKDHNEVLAKHNTEYLAKIDSLNAQITDLTTQITELKNNTASLQTENDNLKVKPPINSANKAFWQSKKFLYGKFSEISSVAVAVYTASGITSNDTYQVMALKLGVAIAGVFGISLVASNYITTQGNIDTKALEKDVLIEGEKKLIK